MSKVVSNMIVLIPLVPLSSWVTSRVPGAAVRIGLIVVGISKLVMNSHIVD